MDQSRYLSSALYRCFKVSGSTIDLVESIEFVEYAVKTSPEGTQEHVLVLNILAVRLWRQSQLWNRGNDNCEAYDYFELQEMALKAFLPQHVSFPHILYNFCVMLDTCETSPLVSKELLDELVEAARKQINSASAHAVVVSLRFRKTGNSVDIDEAIITIDERVSKSTLRDAQYKTHVRGLVCCLNIHYEVTAGLDDLIVQIELLECCVLYNNSDFASWAGELSLMWQFRYEHTSQSSDLEKAIETFQEKHEYKRAQGNGTRGSIHQLGIVLRMQGSHTESVLDIDSAISYLTEAASVECSLQASSISMLGVAYMNRYALTKAQSDLEEAITKISSFFETMPSYI